MEDELKANLRLVFEAFKAVSELSPATIWARAAKDARFMERVESGGGFTVKIYDRALAWFSDNWPSNAIWPADIQRPEPSCHNENGAAA